MYGTAWLCECYRFLWMHLYGFTHYRSNYERVFLLTGHNSASDCYTYVDGQKNKQTIKCFVDFIKFLTLKCLETNNLNTTLMLDTKG